MDSKNRERLVDVMRQLAGGDKAAVFPLYEEFGRYLAAFVRREAARMGVPHIDPDELDGLVIDACLELMDCAAGWDPAGPALPWTWAARRLSKVVARWIGQHGECFDARQHDAAGGPGSGDRDCEEFDVLRTLAQTHSGCALIQEALTRVASTRDQRILLDLRVQEVSGDPSPARTVAVRFGLKPEAVRQVACRVRARLRRLASDDERFAAVAALPLVA